MVDVTLKLPRSAEEAFQATITKLSQEQNLCLRPREGIKHKVTIGCALLLFRFFPKFILWELYFYFCSFHDLYIVL